MNNDLNHRSIGIFFVNMWKSISLHIGPIFVDCIQSKVGLPYTWNANWFERFLLETKHNDENVGKTPNPLFVSWEISDWSHQTLQLHSIHGLLEKKQHNRLVTSTFLVVTHQKTKRAEIYTTWWFPEMGVPLNHQFNGIFPYKPTILGHNVYWNFTSLHLPDINRVKPHQGPASLQNLSWSSFVSMAMGQLKKDPGFSRQMFRTFEI